MDGMKLTQFEDIEKKVSIVIFFTRSQRIFFQNLKNSFLSMLNDSKTDFSIITAIQSLQI